MESIRAALAGAAANARRSRRGGLGGPGRPGLPGRPGRPGRPGSRFDGVPGRLLRALVPPPLAGAAGGLPARPAGAAGTQDASLAPQPVAAPGGRGPAGAGPGRAAPPGPARAWPPSSSWTSLESVPADMREGARELGARGHWPQAGPDDLVGIVTFGATARVELPMGEARDHDTWWAGPAVGRRRTWRGPCDLAAEPAGHRVPSTGSGSILRRIVLLSDGNETARERPAGLAAPAAAGRRGRRPGPAPSACRTPP